jgi:hypothetical protein
MSARMSADGTPSSHRPAQVIRKMRIIAHSCPLSHSRSARSDSSIDSATRARRAGGISLMAPIPYSRGWAARKIPPKKTMRKLATDRLADERNPLRSDPIRPAAWTCWIDWPTG